MPLLTRQVPAPLTVDIRHGAVGGLLPLLADRRISSGGDVAVVVGPGQGKEIAAELEVALPRARLYPIEGEGIEVAVELARRLREGFYDGLVGIGGGRTLDAAKYAASLAGLPMVAVATSLAHDGLASPVSSLEHGGRKASYGVQTPIAVIVDLDYVRASPAEMRRAGIGDVLSNLSAIADWRLAERSLGEPVDGVAVTFARAAAESVLHHPGGVDDDAFLTTLAEALVLSGIAMSSAGSSRPCSGAEHELIHAIDHLFPRTARHGELAAVGTLFCSFLRGSELTAALDECLRRHGLPRVPADVGLDQEQFVRAVLAAPGTRPDRHTVLEELDLDAAGARKQVMRFLREFAA